MRGMKMLQEPRKHFSPPKEYVEHLKEFIQIIFLTPLKQYNVIGFQILAIQVK